MSARLLPTLVALTYVALLAAACGDEVPPASTPSSSASPSRASGVSPTPQVVDPVFHQSVDVVPLATGAPADLPEGIALIIETGCTQCDGPTTGLARVYRDPTGALRTETLFDPKALGFGARLVTTSKGVESADPQITGFALNTDASEIAVSVCVRESCGDGAFYGWSPNAEAVIVRSRDGGITWSELGRATPAVFVAALTGGSQIVVGYWEAELAPTSYAYYPGLEPITPPDPGSAPLRGHSAELLWTSEDSGLIRHSDGSTFADLGPGAAAYWLTTADSQTDRRYALSWYHQTDGPSGMHYLTILDNGAKPIRSYSSREFVLGGVTWEAVAFSDTWSEFAVPPGATPPAGLPATEVPAIIDLASATSHPLLGLFDDPSFPVGRDHPVAVQRGPFVRVVNSEGECLNIRAEPGAGAVLDCAAEGVLLRDLGQAADAEGVAWLRVAMPGGLEGWASTQYLER